MTKSPQNERSPLQRDSEVNSLQNEEKPLRDTIGVNKRSASRKKARNVLTRAENTFVQAVVNGRSLTDAYKKAKPGTLHKTASSMGSRLAKEPHIAARIEKLSTNMTERIGEETIEEMTAHYMSLHDKRMLLTDMMQGKVKVNKFFKMKEGIETIKDNLNPSVLLKAIELDTKLENGWYDRKKIPEIKMPAHAEAVAKPAKEKEPPMPVRQEIYIDGELFDGGEDDILTVEEEKALLQLSLTNKNIVTGKPMLTPSQAEAGYRPVTHPRTGRRFLVHNRVADDALEECWTELDSFYTEPYDDEQLANIAKNSKVITGLLNNEYTLNMYGSLANRKAKQEEKEEQDRNPHASSAPHTTTPSFPAPHSETHSSSELRSAEQPYRSVKEIWEEHWKAWCNTCSQRDHQAYLEAYTMYKAMQDLRQLPKAKASKVWEFHPTDITLMRKKIA